MSEKMDIWVSVREASYLMGKSRAQIYNIINNKTKKKEFEVRKNPVTNQLEILLSPELKDKYNKM